MEVGLEDKPEALVPGGPLYDNLPLSPRRWAGLGDIGGLRWILLGVRAVGHGGVSEEAGISWEDLTSDPQRDLPLCGGFSHQLDDLPVSGVHDVVVVDGGDLIPNLQPAVEVGGSTRDDGSNGCLQGCSRTAVAEEKLETPHTHTHMHTCTHTRTAVLNSLGNPPRVLQLS